MKQYPIWRVKTQRNNCTPPWSHYFGSRKEAEDFYKEIIQTLNFGSKPYIAIYDIEYIGAFKKENAEFYLGRALE